ncbi:MAG: head GIN domain-containing protein [Crocinitomicaceae bacterium]
MLKKGLGLLVMFVSFASMAQETFEIPVDGEFTSVELQGNYEVSLKKGDEQRIEVLNTDENIEDDRIVAEVKGEELIVRIKMDNYRERDIDIVITYVNLENVTAKYGCIVRIPQTITADKCNLEVESGGKIKATVSGKKLEAVIKTGGSIHIDGKVDEATYKISAGGTIGAANMDAKEVVANVNMGGEIICKVDEIFKVKVVSGGTVSYIGDPETFEQKVTLGGTITRIKK